MYSEFEPMVWAQNASRPMRTFPTFDAAMDEFYSKVPLSTVPVYRKAKPKPLLQLAFDASSSLLGGRPAHLPPSTSQVYSTCHDCAHAGTQCLAPELAPNADLELLQVEGQRAG